MGKEKLVVSLGKDTAEEVTFMLERSKTICLGEFLTGSEDEAEQNKKFI